MKLDLARAAMAVMTFAAACNEVGGIEPPILDADVIPCKSDAACAAAAPTCRQAVGCIDGFCELAPAGPRSCYSGPAGTEGVAACKAGEQTCDPVDLEYGECIGEILPSAEDCDAEGIDEDCDGLVNEEGPSCTCGDGYLSAGEECDDANAQDDDGCSTSCVAAVCGDGVIQPGAEEQCDDGGAEDGDACSPTCQLQEVLSVAAGVNHTCAVLTGGRVKCWGQNARGQLGVGDLAPRGAAAGDMGKALPAVDLGLGRRAVALAAGNCHTCALLSAGGVKCWGCNDFGQLGLEDLIDRGGVPGDMGDALPNVGLGPGVNAKAISAGYEHTCALLEDGGVKCWGRNNHGQLGQGDKVDRGGAPDQMGGALLPVDVATVIDPTVTALATGREHTCALLVGGQVKCWGHNNAGQLGQGDKNDRGDAVFEMGDYLFPVDLGFNQSAVAVAAGHLFSCALLASGGLECWGRNSDGQLGQGDTNDRGDAVAEMGDLLPPIDLGAGKSAVLVAGGGSYACALLTGGSIKCWGDADAGQLGLGDAVARGNGPDEMGDNLPAVSLGTGKVPVGLTASMVRTCAWFDDRSVKCWGKNGAGQLGLGDLEDRGNGPGEMGDDLPIVKLFSAEW